MSNSAQRMIFVVDGDERTGQEVQSSVRGVRVKSFRSGQEFLQYFDRTLVGCLIVNIALPDMSGVELQNRLLAQYCTLPLIFVGTGSSVAEAVQVIRKGAIDFLDRPFQKQDLSAAVSAALKILEQDLNQNTELAEYAARFDQLTPREREVLDQVVSGKSNKSIADALGVSVKTVETHRLRLMSKVQVKSLAELVRAALRLQRFRDEHNISSKPLPTSNNEQPA